MELYYDIPHLLKAYRDSYSLSQLDLAIIVGVDERSVRRWESGKSKLKDIHEIAIVRQLKIPYKVIRLLNASIPVLFNIITKRYSMSEYFSEFFNSTVFFEDDPDEITTDQLKAFKGADEIQNIIDYDQSIYNAPNNVKFEVIKKATELLPELNLYVTDIFGFHTGHLATLPLKQVIYEKLKNRIIHEGQINTRDLIRPANETQISLYVYSIYCACGDTTHKLLPKAIENFKYLRSNLLNYESSLSGYAVTLDGNNLAIKLKMTKVFESLEEQLTFKTEFIPTFFEINIMDLKLP